MTYIVSSWYIIGLWKKYDAFNEPLMTREIFQHANIGLVSYFQTEWNLSINEFIHLKCMTSRISLPLRRKVSLSGWVYRQVFHKVQFRHVEGQRGRMRSARPAFCSCVEISPSQEELAAILCKSGTCSRDFRCCAIFQSPIQSRYLLAKWRSQLWIIIAIKASVSVKRMQVKKKRDDFILSSVVHLFCL